MHIFSTCNVWSHVKHSRRHISVYFNVFFRSMSYGPHNPRCRATTYLNKYSGILQLLGKINLFFETLCRATGPDFNSLALKLPLPKPENHKRRTSRWLCLYRLPIGSELGVGGPEIVNLNEISFLNIAQYTGF